MNKRRIMANKSISDSAFLVNESRSRRVDISQDIYASLWINEATNKLWNDFNNEVYTYDDIQLSLRNRFFLDQLKSFIEISSNPVFINIGAGFTSYPYLISKNCKSIEVDLPSIIEYKKMKIHQFIKKGDLPKIDVTFLTADLCKKDELIILKKSLNHLIDNNPSFILLEGITYFLKKEHLNQLFYILSGIQTQNSILAFDYWKSDDADHPVLKRLMRFFSDRFGFTKNQYTLLDLDFIENIMRYRHVESADIQKLEKKYTTDNFLSDHNKILPEYYYVMRLTK